MYSLLQTVDQFFALRVPMRVGELQWLHQGLDKAFQVYTLGVVAKIGEDPLYF